MSVLGSVTHKKKVGLLPHLPHFGSENDQPGNGMLELG